MTAAFDNLLSTIAAEGLEPEEVGVVVVDHGSRKVESNRLLEDVAAAFAKTAPRLIVEPAHMELAEPSIATAFANCVRRGARLVVVFPYFLGPGRHWNEDIPRLSAQAASGHPGVRHLVTAPLGLHELLLQVMHARISHCLDHALRGGPTCDLCSEFTGCMLQPPVVENSG